MPTLLASAPEQLALRLGERATVDDPIFGRTSSMPALQRYLEEVAAWLGKHQASFDRVAFTMGSDRDVTEGTLGLEFNGRRVRVPLAIVCERRKEREVEVRLYYSTKPINGSRTVRAPLLPQDDAISVPVSIGAYLTALGKGDVAGVVAAFEMGGKLRDAAGTEFTRTIEGGSLTEHYARLFQGADRGLELQKGARADDGVSFALEYTIVKVRGKAVSPQAGLVVFERGDSGLLKAVRVYEDLDL